MKKYILSFSLCLALAVSALLLLTSCEKYKDILNFGKGNRDGKQYDYHIVVSVHPDNTPWRNSVLNWAWKAREELERDRPGVTVDVVLARDEHEQAMQLHTLSRKGAISALVIVADVPESVASYCREFRRKGTLIIAVHNNIVFQQCPNVFVSGDNYQIGQESAKAIVNALGGDNAQGTILAFSNFSNPAIKSRLASFREELTKYMNVSVKEIDYKDYGTTPYDAMAKLLKDGVKFDAIWTGWDSILEDVIRACEAEADLSVKAFVGGNGSSNINKMMLAQNINVPVNTTYPPKMMYDAIMMAFEKLSSSARNEQALAPPEIVILPTEVITKENAKSFVNRSDSF